MQVRTLVLILLTSLAPSLAPSLAAADDNVVNDSGKTLELTCGDGGKVVVNGAQNEITITGNCAKLAVNGAMNDIEIEAVDKIAVNGTGNTIAWQRGWKAKAPKVAKTGRNNKVTRAK